MDKPGGRAEVGEMQNRVDDHLPRPVERHIPATVGLHHHRAGARDLVARAEHVGRGVSSTSTELPERDATRPPNRTRDPRHSLEHLGELESGSSHRRHLLRPVRRQPSLTLFRAPPPATPPRAAARALSLQTLLTRHLQACTQSPSTASHSRRTRERRADTAPFAYYQKRRVGGGLTKPELHLLTYLTYNSECEIVSLSDSRRCESSHNTEFAKGACAPVAFVPVPPYSGDSISSTEA